MLSDDELRDLADDIEANGLLHPIVLDDQGRIVDGRNRDAACRLKRIEPDYVTLNGHDPVAFILSQNIARRHLSKGQQALIVVRARIYESYMGQDEVAGAVGLPQSLISQAGLILRWAPDIGEEVLGGTRPFDAALKEARDRKAAASSAEAQLKRLQAAAPDLATRVVDEHMDLAEAIGALKVRQQQEAERRRATSQLADTMLVFLDPGDALTSVERAAQIVATLDASSIPTRPDFSAQRFRRGIATLGALLALVTQQEEHDGHDAVSVE